MKIFLDCGANDGCSIIKFRKDIDTLNEFKIVSFEANPKFKQEIESHGVEYINAAVSDFDGEADFYLDRAKGYSSSLLKEKRTGNLDKINPLKVKVIDLSKYILENTSASDFIILKLDVEGAEYKILEKMIKDNSLARVSKLYIDWHWNKIGLTKAYHDSLLKKLNIEIEHWDATI